MKNLIKSITFSLLLLTALPVFGVGFAPVRNFSRQTYMAGSQNWAVSQDPAGRMYFANRDGLLKYDGKRWSLFHLPNYSTVRAVFADDKTGRIYVGGFSEFGFFATDSITRRLKYESWTATLQNKEKETGEIWNIHEIEEGKLAFQADYRIYISDGVSTAVAESKDKLTSSAIIRGKLYAGTQNGTIFRLDGERLELVATLGENCRIVALLPHWNDLNTIIIVTAAQGIFLYDHGEFKRGNWGLDDFLIRNQAFSATYSDGVYAFGTVNQGAVVKNVDTDENIYVNKQTGLQNNTVLGLGFDFSSNLWLCLDNGISYAMVDSSVFNLLGESSEAGAGYASMLKDNILYLATNRGLYTAPYPFVGEVTPPELKRIHSGQVWGLDSIGNDIFISADDGLYLMNQRKGGAITKIEGIDGGSWYIAPLKHHPGKLLASTYNGFYLLTRENGIWKATERVNGYVEAGGKFVEDSDGKIWIAHWIKGIYKLTLAPDLKSFSDVKLFTTEDGLPSERDNSLAIYNGKLRIATASGEFFMPDSHGNLVRDDYLSKQIPLKYPAHFYALPSGISFAFSPRLVWKMTKDSQGKMTVDSVSLRMVANSLIPGFEHVGFLDKNNMLVSHQEGFFSINLTNKQSDKWKNDVFIESLSSGDSILFAGLSKGPMPEITIPYTLNSLTFNFAAPEYRYDNAILYSCMLENYDNGWSSPSESASKEYTRLHEGEYTLKLKAHNTITGETAESSFRFKVLPPWYRSVPAKIAYAILILLTALLVYRLFIYLSKRNAQKIKEQKEAELEMMRKEAEKEAIKKDFEIATLKGEQLELDIKHKSSELSNTTMNVIRKNEILLDISSMLTKLHNKADAEGHTTPNLKKEMDKIQALIQENISHDDDWKKFNQNFDIVYADFTKRLSEAHPELTVSEKRLCCYLKMGLSSKEIAPIFSISPKSVEMNRYRLRRKLGLDREENLVEYLQNI